MERDKQTIFFTPAAAPGAQTDAAILEALRAFLRPLIEAEVRRAVAEAKAQLASPSHPLGIEPTQLYKRKDAARLLLCSESTLRRAELQRGLARRGPNSDPMYLGSDLIKLALKVPTPRSAASERATRE